MEHRVKVTVLDKKLFPELQAQYCAVPDSGKCPCYNVGDEFMFYRNDERDDYWHMGAGTLIKSGKTDEGVRQILVDKETGVNYLCWKSGYGAGITPLLDSEGKVIVTK